MSKIQFSSDEGRKIGRRGPNIPSFKLRITIILKPIILLLFDLNMDRNYKYLFLHIFFYSISLRPSSSLNLLVPRLRNCKLLYSIYSLKNFATNCACCTLKKRIKKSIGWHLLLFLFFFNTHFLSSLETHMHTSTHLSLFLSFSLSLHFVRYESF